MATEDTTGSIKRRRVVAGDVSSSDDSSSAALLRLHDLPIEPLTYVANFLAAPSRAMFAVALAAAPFSDDGLSSESSRKIAGDKWDTLDFGDIEKELAVRLTDDHVDAILRCIDAANKLKILRTTNCINITGAGLGPLRGSVIIEKIDLSLLGDHEDPFLRPDPPISCVHILPILDTIIIVEGSALKHLQFPIKWHVGRTRTIGSDFNEFLARFNQMLCNRGMRCLNCNKEAETAVELDNSREEYAIQFSTCFACSKHYCYDCRDDNGDYFINLCNQCRRAYCSDCSETYECGCGKCDRYFCVKCDAPAECSESECDVENLSDFCREHCKNCQRPYCEDCHTENKCDVCNRIGCGECTSYLECEDCYFGHCVDCIEEAGINGIHSCGDCGRRQCINCRLRRPYPADRSCSGCFEIIAKPWVGG